jgi:hypothetical protein
VTVAVCVGLMSVLIQVRDDGGQSEADDRAGASITGNERGYGLLLVEALAETWGTIATTEGRVTWCRLAVDRSGEGTRRR